MSKWYSVFQSNRETAYKSKSPKTAHEIGNYHYLGQNKTKFKKKIHFKNKYIINNDIREAD